MVIQCEYGGQWVDIATKIDWSLPEDRYRIKPKTKTLYQWVIKEASTPESPNYFLTEMFYENKEEVKEYLTMRTSEVLHRAE